MSKLTEQTLLLILEQQTLNNMLKVTELSLTNGIKTDTTIEDSLEITTERAAEAIEYVITHTAPIKETTEYLELKKAYDELQNENNSLRETLHLLQSPKNATRLMDSISETESGKLIKPQEFNK